MLEEVLRYKAPVHGMFRRTTRDARVGDVIIPAGAFVWLVFSTGGWDEATFPEPARFDITRPNANRRRCADRVHP